MIKTLDDILEMLKAVFPCKRVSIIQGRSRDYVELSIRKCTFRFELVDHRNLKSKQPMLADKYVGKLCLGFDFLDRGNLKGRIWMSVVDESTTDEVIKFITDNSSLKPLGFVQLALL